jgi:putative sterol carrier protein
MEFLSDDWLDAMARAADGASVPADLRLVVQQVVEGAGGEVAYAIRIGEGRVTVARGHEADADVSFTQDETTARAIASGELSAQAAFMEGRLRVGGDLRSLLDHAAALAALEDVFGPARAEVTW